MCSDKKSNLPNLSVAEKGGRARIDKQFASWLEEKEETNKSFPRKKASKKMKVRKCEGFSCSKGTFVS